MNEVFIQALAARIKAGQMTIEQIPVPYQEKVLELVKGDDTVEPG